MQSDLSQLGGFARATVQQLTRAGFVFAGVENGVVRLTPPTGGQPLEFTNDAYVSASVAGCALCKHRAVARRQPELGNP